MIVVEVRQEETRRRRRGGGGEEATDIKSNNPHLAGGESKISFILFLSKAFLFYFLDFI